MPDAPLPDDVGPHPAYHRRVRLPLAKFLVGLLYVLFGPLWMSGGRRVPKKGGLLILANHQSDVDPPLVQVACRRPIHFMAKSELFDMKVVGPFIRKFKAFPVKRGEPDRASLKRAITLLKAGEVVAVFPEGELSKTGRILPLKPGIALMVRMSGVQVICCGLHNTRGMMPYGKLIPRPAFAWIKVKWGEARSFGKDASNEEILEWVESELVRLSGYERATPEDVALQKA